MAELLTNFRAGMVPHLEAAAKQRSCTFASKTAADIGKAASGDVVFWEAGTGGDITAEQIAALQEAVRVGANLVLSLARGAGKLPARMSTMLPTIGWGATIGYLKSQQDRPCEAGKWDEMLFAQGEPKGLALPYSFPIRPFAAVERGEGRYERYERKIPKMDRDVKPQNVAWTRPLLNHEWRVRVMAADRADSPLVVTGKYGAGRVIVLAGSAVDFDASPQAQALWSALLGWALEKRALPNPAAESANDVKVSVSSGAGRVQVRVENGGAAARNVRVFARVLTWEGALIGDVGPQGSPLLAVPAGGGATADLMLPRASMTSYQALTFKDAVQVRVGVLSEDESTVLAERGVTVDSRPPIHMQVHTDAMGSLADPFDKPDEKNYGALHNRMGAAVGTYAYKPGATVNASVSLANGMRNLAPFAAVVDLVNKENKTVMALNDEATNYRKGPVDAIQAWASWEGKSNSDNVLLFMFPRPVTVAAITIVGSDGNTQDGEEHNPTSAIVAFDDKEVLRASLETAFKDGYGQAYVPLKQPGSVTKMTIRFPWVNALPGKRRQAPWLGDIRVLGWVGDTPPAQKGSLEVALENAMTGEAKVLLTQDVELAPGERKVVKVAAKLPQDAEMGFYRIRAKMGGAEESAPVLAIKGEKSLKPITDVIPADSASLGFIVTRGFRNIFTTGTGTAEIIGGWGQPDDLVWAYSRNLKQIRQQARTNSAKLFVTEDDMRHYSTPWKSFSNGEFVFDIGTPLMVEHMKASPNWSKSPFVHLDFSDRWDTGPDVAALCSWQDYVEFDRELRRRGKPGLKGKTRSQVGAEIQAEHESEWQLWHLTRYCDVVTKMRNAFKAEGKDLTILAQGLPIVASQEAAAALSPTIRGMSDDSTWGMISDSTPLTTGRQLAEIAFNPSWKVSVVGNWAYPSSVLNNEHWHSPVSTTEPSRRAIYDHAWRGMVWQDGSYGSVYTYGYNSNVGLAYTMNDNDWQQWWMTLERHSLLWPEAPIGAGLVYSSSRFAEPEHVRFSCTDAVEANELIPTYARAFEYLHMAGVPVAFGANIRTMETWTGDAPLILLNPAAFNEKELATVAALQKRGVKMVSFGKAGVQGVTVLDVDPETFTAPAAVKLLPKMDEALKLPIVFPEGVTGYGFRQGKTQFVVVEDWVERGRRVAVRVRCTSAAKTARACSVNEHVNVAVKRDGEFWEIAAPLRPGDANLFALEEMA